MNWSLQHWLERAFLFSPRLGLLIPELLWRVILRRTSGTRAAAIPNRREIRRLFRKLRRREARSIQRRCAECFFKSDILKTVEKSRGHDLLDALIEVEPESEALLRDLAHRKSPVMVTTWHLGPTPGIWATLRRLPVSLLKIQNRKWAQVPQGWEISSGAANAAEGARLIRKVRKHLGEGGWVAMTFDHTFFGSRRNYVPLLGRKVMFKSGMPAVAALTGVPVVLISARWSDDGKKVMVRVHDLIQADPNDPGAEKMILEKLVKEMERYVIAYPWEQSGVRYRRLLEFPRLEKHGIETPGLPGDRWRKQWTAKRRAAAAQAAMAAKGPGL